MKRKLCAPKGWCSIVVGCFMMACTTEPPPSSPPPAVENSALAQVPSPRIVTNDCVGPVQDGPVENIPLGEATWRRSGSTLASEAPRDRPWVLGVLADIKENTAENMTNLAAFLESFRKRKVDAIVVAGDTGSTPEQMVAVWTALARSELPIFVIIGNREGQRDYRQALDKVTGDFANVFDLNEIRRVNTPQADLVSLPGYGNRDYVHATDGCQYTADDLHDLRALVDSADSPVVLVSHGGPLQSGSQGLDRTTEGQNVGDPRLAAFMKDAGVPFGIFGNIHEAGGRATDLLGGRRLAEGAWAPRLYLNPGPADAVRWQMNDGTVSVGMAAVMHLGNRRARYEVIRAGGTVRGASPGKRKSKVGVRKGKRRRKGKDSRG